jgi:hypothetical protein
MDRTERDPLRAGDAQAFQAVAASEKGKGSVLHERFSVFWGTPSTLRGGRDGRRFPPLDRLDLIENGRILAGSYPQWLATTQQRRAPGERG